MGPAEVTVVTLHAEKVALKTELPGRTTASLSSEVRPQITGIVKARTFEEGARVKAGQVLYQIEPAQYRAAVAGAEADSPPRRPRSRRASSRTSATRAWRRSRACRSRRPTTRASCTRRWSRPSRRRPRRSSWRGSTSATRRSSRRSAGTSASRASRPARSSPRTSRRPLATIRALDPIYVDLTESNEQRLRLRAQVGCRRAASRHDGGEAAAPRRLHVRAGGHARVLRGRRRRGDRHRDAAREVPEPRRRCCCPACTCARCSARRS